MTLNWTMVMVILVAIQLIFSIYSHCVIKFNDFVHVANDMKDIKEAQQAHGEKLNDISDRVSYLEGREGIQISRKRKAKDNKKKDKI